MAAMVPVPARAESAASLCEACPSMKRTLAAKLHPDRFTEMSPRMAAIVGYIVDERFSEPAIAEMVVTSDGFVLARMEGEVGTDEMIGSEADLDRNLLALIEAAGLTDEEVREFGLLQRERIVRWGERGGLRDGAPMDRR